MSLTHPILERSRLLLVISEVFGKLLLTRLSSQISKIHPVQRDFGPKTSCIHTAFILQEAIHQLCSRRKKAHLDVKKAFDTAWHDGSFLKPLLFGVPFYICTTCLVVAPLSPALSLFTRRCAKVQSSHPLYTIQNLCQRPSNAPLFICTWCHSQWILLWSPHICR